MAVRVFNITGDREAPVIVADLTSPVKTDGRYYLGTSSTITIAGAVSDNAGVAKKLSCG